MIEQGEFDRLEQALALRGADQFLDDAGTAPLDHLEVAGQDTACQLRRKDVAVRFADDRLAGETGGVLPRAVHQQVGVLAVRGGDRHRGVFQEGDHELFDQLQLLFDAQPDLDLAAQLFVGNGKIAGPVQDSALQLVMGPFKGAILGALPGAVSLVGPAVAKSLFHPVEMHLQKAPCRFICSVLVGVFPQKLPIALAQVLQKGEKGRQGNRLPAAQGQRGVDQQGNRVLAVSLYVTGSSECACRTGGAGKESRHPGRHLVTEIFGQQGKVRLVSPSYHGAKSPFGKPLRLTGGQDGE